MDVCVKNNYRYSMAQGRDYGYGIKLKLFQLVDMYLKVTCIYTIYHLGYE